MKDSGRVRNPSGRILALIETFISRQTTDVPIQSMAKIFDTRKYTRNICPICFYERPRKTTNSRGSTLRLLARASYLFLSSQNIRLRGCHYAILGDIILGKKIMMLLRKGTRSYRDYKFYGNLYLPVFRFAYFRSYSSARGLRKINAKDQLAYRLLVRQIAVNFHDVNVRTTTLTLPRESVERFHRRFFAISMSNKILEKSSSVIDRVRRDLSGLKLKGEGINLKAL